MRRKASANKPGAIWVESLFTLATWRVKEGQLAAVLTLLADLMTKSTPIRPDYFMRVLTLWVRCEVICRCWPQIGFSNTPDAKQVLRLCSSATVVPDEAKFELRVNSTLISPHSMRSTGLDESCDQLSARASAIFSLPYGAGKTALAESVPAS